MKTTMPGIGRRWHSALHLFSLVAVLAFLGGIVRAEDTPAPSPKSATAAASPVDAAAAGASAGKPDPAEMMKLMMEMAELNENHKLLGELVGTWDYTVKYWFDPSAPVNESKGIAVRKPTMDGRFFILESEGKMQMPGADGRMKQMDFKGTSIEGYDNAKKKFFATWMDNMSTGLMLAEGSYDPATKTYTYHATMELLPGEITKVRETVKVIDKDHHLFEFFEDRGGKEVRTMEITYARKK